MKKDSDVRVPYRLDLGIGSVLQVAEALGDGYKVDVIFEKDSNLFKRAKLGSGRAKCMPVKKSDQK